MADGLAAWMGRIPDDVSLSDVSIPGTHDSATYRAAASDFVLPLNIVYAAAQRGAKFVQCQSLTLREQLDAGVRFLDLRIMPGERFPLYHGPAPLMIDLAFALDEVDNFLAENGTETVIVSIKQESDYDRKQTSIDLKAFLQRRSNRPFMEGRIPALGEVRGKAVIFNRVFELDGNGIFLHFDDNRAFAKTQLQGDGSTNLRFAIQDAYNPSPGWFSSTLTAKEDAIRSGYEDYATGDYALRIAFASAGCFPTRTPGEFASDINPQVASFVRDHARGRAWITVLDYVGVYGRGADDPVAEIVSMNRLISGRAAGSSDTLTVDQSLAPGQALVSENMAYEARFLGDGNFVVVRTVDDRLLAETATRGSGATRATLQDDGNFVVCVGDRPIAASMSQKEDASRMTMQDDGNLVVYGTDGTPRWASRTAGFSH